MNSRYSNSHHHSREFSVSTSSTTSSTSSLWSTIWGPGTLSGKVLEAFGEATLRGVENLVIRRKLASLRSIFPHKNNAVIKNLDFVYDDVLELSRPELYPKTVGRIAIRLLLVQVEGGETEHLIKALGRWPEIEIRFFLSQIMSEYLLDVEKWHDQYTGDTSTRRKSSVDVPKESLRLIPVINFISLLAQHNDFALHAALEGGFLDMLLRIYVVLPTFYMSATASTTEKRSRKSAILDACRFALDVFSAESQYFDVVFNHPVHDLWLRFDGLVPDYIIWTPEEALDARCVAWRRAEVDIIKRRMMTIWSLLSSLEARSKNVETQACMDIVEFSRSQFYSPDIVEFALLTMFRCIITGDKVVKRFIIILNRHLGQDTVFAISGIIRLCLKCTDVHSVIEDGFFGDGELIGHSRMPTFSQLAAQPGQILDGQKIDFLFGVNEKHVYRLPRRKDFLYKVINFGIAAAKHSTAFCQSLLDAGALALVPVTFVEGLPILSGTLDVFTQHTEGLHSKIQHVGQVAESSCISISMICTETRILLDAFKAPAEKSLLKSQVFIKRRRYCYSLMHALLGQSVGMGDAYTEICTLFSELLD